MKKLLLTLVCILSMFAVKAQCEYTFEATDSWGDGWNDANMDVLVDGVVVLDDIAANVGAGGNVATTDLFPFAVTTGADVTTVWNADGNFPGEISWRILDPMGNEVFSGVAGDAVTTGTITAACPDCPTPSGITITPAAFDAVISWEDVTQAINGYIVIVFNAGDDPMVDVPVYTENVAAGTLMTTATGLMQQTMYDVYIISDCDTEVSAGPSIPFTTELSCNQPVNLQVAMTTATEITYTWDEVAEAENGYILNVYVTGADPMVDMPVYTENIAAGTLTATATGLDNDTIYDAYVISDCGDVNGMSLASIITINTSFDSSCGGVFLDSGGTGAGYSFSESTTTTIMPDFPGQQIVTVTFTYVDIEAGGAFGTDGCFDFLTVYDGPDTASPVLAMTLCGEESGDGGLPDNPENVLSIGTSFTSSHPSGALTFVFTSDASVQETGWEADVTCEGECEAPQNFTNDSVTQTTADFSWDAVTGPTEGYIFAVFEDGANPDPINGDDPIFVSQPTAATAGTADGLAPNTEYDAYMANICVLGEDFDTSFVSELVGPVDFITAELGINDVEFTNFALTPNPAIDVLNISNDRTIDSIEIYNMLGQRVLSNTSSATDITLDVSSLSNGAYFLKATVEGNVATQKFIKK